MDENMLISESWDHVKCSIYEVLSGSSLKMGTGSSLSMVELEYLYTKRGDLS